VADWTKEIFGDVRYNAVFFMLGIFAVGIAFALELVASLLPFIQGGPPAVNANEYALFITLAAGLLGVGFLALGLGALVFAQNYEPIQQEARLVTFSAVPYGVFVIASHLARVQQGGVNDFFAYSVSRTQEGTATTIVAVPESYAALGPYLAVGSFAAVVCCFGLSYFLANMKIVKQVGELTLRMTKLVGILAFAGQLLLFAGWSTFTADNTAADWLGVPYILYFVGYLILAFALPTLGVIVAWRVGAIYWDAAKTVRYLSDFRKRATAVAESRKAEKDERPWWEKLAEGGNEEK
jgi:hypothetical protein